jgi:small membrane protein
MVIQIVLIVTAMALLAIFIRSSHTVRAQAFKRMGFVLFLVATCYAVLRPNDMTWLANELGVGRGTDLVLYVLVIVFAFFAVNTYLRFRNLERRFTDFARSVALQNAQAPVRNLPSDAAPAGPAIENPAGEAFAEAVPGQSRRSA